MKKIILAVLIIMLSVSVAWGGCANLWGANGWRVLNAHRLIVYRFSTPIALLSIQYCNLDSNSEIEFLKDFMCSFDKIIIDGEVCDVQNAESL